LHFTGSSRFERDVLGVYTLPRAARPPLEIGDILTFENLNGYSNAWNASFNGVPEARLRIA